MTLLSIVGEDISRIIPLLYTYQDKFKHHVLLCDDDASNHARAKSLQKGMMRFSAINRLGWYVQIVTTNEDSASQIEMVANKQFKHKGELWLNATDGYPAMTILLSDIVRKEGGKVLSYDHFDNDIHIIESNGKMLTEQLSGSMDLESYLTLLNYKIVDKQTKKELMVRKEIILELYKDENKFIKIRQEILNYYFHKSSDSSYKKESELVELLKELNILDHNFELISSQQKALQGDLFEEYIFWLTEALSPDDIAMSVKIDFDDELNEPEARKRIYNEFDILLMNKNRIYTIECKFSKNLEGLEFIYKYDAIIDYFGKASKAIITNISSHPKQHYIGSKASRNFNHSTLRRARLAGVSVYHESEVDVIKFQSLVRNFFKMQ